MVQAFSPLMKLPTVAGFNSIYLKDESENPTGTFKDRMVRSALSSLPSEALIATISYGNTAVSLAFHLNSSGAQEKARRACVLVPEDMASWTLGPSSSGTLLSGRAVRSYLERSLDVVDLPIGGPILSEDQVCAVAASAVGWTGLVVDITEGTSEPAYEAIISEAIDQLGRTPDVCLVPFGAGILCNQVMDWLAGSGCVVVALSVASRDSAARMLFGPTWLDVAALESDGVGLSRHRSPDRTGAVRAPYPVHLVTESEVLAGVDRARALGISAEPSGAVGLGVLDRLRDMLPGISCSATIVVIATGNGIDRFATIADVAP